MPPSERSAERPEAPARERSFGRRAVEVRRLATGLLVGTAVIAVLVAIISQLNPAEAPLGLTGLYIVASAPVAIRWGFLAAGSVIVLAALTFALVYEPPVYGFQQFYGPHGAASLVIALTLAYVLSALARREHARADEAQQRAREAEEAHREIGRLAAEQEALRRVATLVAEAVPTQEIFDAVIREVGVHCDADLARIERFEADPTVTAIAAWSRGGQAAPEVGARLPLDRAGIAGKVCDTGRPARLDSLLSAAGTTGRAAQGPGARSALGCPIVVGGRVWGVIAAFRRSGAAFLPGMESRIADFADIVGTAIANAEARNELVASRARLITAEDEARRRIVRDLHDGVQARLVHAIVSLKLAKRAQANDDEEARRGRLDQGLGHVEKANDELRELAHGIMPAVLARGGLAAGIEELVSRAPLPIRIDVPPDRFAREVETGAYFIVAEALSNILKHSRATSARVTAGVDASALRVEVRDDGVGGARPDGSGLIGLRDRITALGGRLRIDSAPGNGTRIAATLPLDADSIASPRGVLQRL